MTLNLTVQKTNHTDFTPRIAVFGVGGGGTNAVNNMIALNLTGVEFVVANTDAQQLLLSRAERRIQLGPHITQGNGAGGKPEVGRASAEEAEDELARQLDGAHMAFITAGMGGGTGTGAAPVIARMARERGILTIGVVTKPFAFEGKRRMRAAEEGIAELQNFVDTLIVIPNQNLFKVANERTGWKEAFAMADHVLYMGVRGVTDLMVVPGEINLDYADVRSVMSEMGKAMMGTGEAEGEDRAMLAAEAAISNPLLEETNMKGARGLLINITGSSDLTLFEVDQAANRIREEADEDANIMFGMALDESLGGRVRVSVVATGIDTATPALAERPRLVAVGGGNVMVDAIAGTMPHTQGQSMMAPQGMIHSMPAAGPAQAFAHGPALSVVNEATPIILDQSAAIEEARHPAPMSAYGSAPALRAPSAAPTYRETPRAPVPEPTKRASLFARMTSGFRAPEAEAPRAETQRQEPTRGYMAPAVHPQMAAPAPMPVTAHQPNFQAPPAQAPAGPQPMVRQTQAEDVALEIPAFLRRQQS